MNPNISKTSRHLDFRLFFFIDFWANTIFFIIFVHPVGLELFQKLTIYSRSLLFFVFLRNLIKTFSGGFPLLKVAFGLIFSIVPTIFQESRIEIWQFLWPKNWFLILILLKVCSKCCTSLCSQFRSLAKYVKKIYATIKKKIDLLCDAVLN